MMVRELIIVCLLVLGTIYWVIPDTMQCIYINTASILYIPKYHNGSYVITILDGNIKSGYILFNTCLLLQAMICETRLTVN